MFKLVAAIAAAVCASAAFAHPAVDAARAPSTPQLTPVQYVVPSYDRFHRGDQYRFEREHGYYRHMHRDMNYARWMHERRERLARYEWRRAHEDRYAHFRWERHHRHYVG